MKVLLITNMIAPYRIPLFNFLDKEGDFDFKVVALTEREKNREWRIIKRDIEFVYKILPGWHFFISRLEWSLHLNFGLSRELLNYKPDIVITSGYDALAYWFVFFYCRLFRKKYILWSGSTLLSSSAQKRTISLLKKVIIRGADACVAYGTKAANYLKKFGANKGKIFIGCNTVDMQWFRRKVFEYRGKDKFKKERSSYPEMLILFVGRLVSLKRVDKLLSALKRVNDPDIGLIVVGSGDQEEKLKRFCEINNLENVYFKGFQQKQELPKYYTLADVLILPSSREVWGLVVNEALASGLYVLCSKYAGAGYDLIREGENGQLFNYQDLADYILKVKNNLKNIRQKRKKISEQACREFGIPRYAQSFQRAIKYCS